MVRPVFEEEGTEGCRGLVKMLPVAEANPKRSQATGMMDESNPFA